MTVNTGKKIPSISGANDKMADALEMIQINQHQTDLRKTMMH